MTPVVSGLPDVPEVMERKAVASGGEIGAAMARFT